MARARAITSGMESAAQLTYKVATVNESACNKKGSLAPFTVFVNPATKHDDELRAAMRITGDWTGEPKFVALTDATRPYHGKHVAKVDSDKIGAGEAGKASGPLPAWPMTRSPSKLRSPTAPPPRSKPRQAALAS